MRRGMNKSGKKSKKRWVGRSGIRSGYECELEAKNGGGLKRNYMLI